MVRRAARGKLLWPWELTCKQSSGFFARNPEDFATANELAARNFHIAADICRRKSMEPERLERCSSLQLAVMAGIYVDKAMAFQDRIPPGGLDIDKLAAHVERLDSAESYLRSREINVQSAQHPSSHDDVNHGLTGGCELFIITA
jgi:hypothetical protein